MENYKSFISEGIVSLVGGESNEKPKPDLVTFNNKLGLENPMHREDCADLEAKKEEDTEIEVRFGNDQQPIKLQNLQLLNDVNTKLSHLPSVQRKEIAEVINQYRKYFLMSQIRQILYSMMWM